LVSFHKIIAPVLSALRIWGPERSCRGLQPVPLTSTIGLPMSHEVGRRLQKVLEPLTIILIFKISIVLSITLVM